ncbi:MAG: hypothetical protein QOC77_870 [Thermoleophilaceae bacterium]|jgi:enoyl-CoA hydratase/carnithine racemase|nr:hypothetical protein [Thermoleophilaceae bacterium]
MRSSSYFDVRVLLEGARGVPATSPTAFNTILKTVGAALKLPGAGRMISRSPVAGLAGVERDREVYLSIERCSAVWVAALNGDAGGGGCELALACDFRFMADGDFRIGQPEIFLGFPPGGGGTQRLARLLGRGAALRLCLDGGPLTPQEACEIGLVDRVVAPAELLDAAVAEASRLGRRPKQAIGAVKRAINIGGSLPLVDGLRLEAAEFLSTIGTPESIAAQEAYVRRTDELGELPSGVPGEIERVLDDGRFR